MFIITKIETAVYLAEALCINVHKSPPRGELGGTIPWNTCLPGYCVISFYIVIFTTFPNHIN